MTNDFWHFYPFIKIQSFLFKNLLHFVILVLIGVHYLGIPKCGESLRRPGIYAAIGFYRDWIDSVIAKA